MEQKQIPDRAIFADLQVHSRYARATSKNLSIDNLEKYGKIKGLNLIGTGDFQHPLHRKEIDEKLIENDNGILRTKSGSGVAFLWQTEISLMFSQGGKGRAVHLLVFAPNKKIADKITNYLISKGRIDYDGRPIFGIPCEQFVKDLKEIEDKIEIIPAHCMTPYFGIFGSKSGFDSLRECFGEQTEKIHAVESGMSADPSMLWRFEEIATGEINIVSFSDAHSFWPWRIGREATVFDVPELSYNNIIKAIRTGEGLNSTIETPPAYGRYHFDGHRNCGFSSSPEKTAELKGICPICKKQLIIGVENRVEQLAYNPLGFKPKNAKPFYKILPLHELIAAAVGSGLESRKTWEIYNSLINNFGNEFNVLFYVTKEKMLEKKFDNNLVEIIIKNREEKIKIKPGYDGVYGEIITEEEQKKLF